MMAQDTDTYSFAVDDDNAGQRLDRFLSAQCTDISRTRLKNLIVAGEVSLSGDEVTDPSRKLKSGDLIQFKMPEAVDDNPQPENIPLDIVYEDDDLLVINKQVGLVVHPGAGNYSGTLVNALLYHCGDSLSGIGGVKRPGIVHRLDKETSGLMVVAKNDKAHGGLASQLSDRSLSRQYKALVWKIPAKKGVVDEPVGRHPQNRLKMTVNRRNGREARTHYEVEKNYSDTMAMVNCRLESGRTHQIRVHMAHIGHNLVGDPVYGLQTNAQQSLLRKAGYDDKTQEIVLGFPRQALHAWHIAFIHPETEEKMTFESALPDDLKNIIYVLNQ